jgi:RNA polymerase sigma-70 factor (ECF subfamily)
MDAQEADAILTSLFESDYSTFLRYSVRGTHNLGVAEDLVQEAFMLLYKELRYGKRVDNPKAWAFCVIRRLISKQVRAWQRNTALQEALVILDEFTINCNAVVTEIASEDIIRLFSVLTRREQEVMILRMAPLKYREIADRLGISPKSVNTLLARALRKMQKAAAIEMHELNGCRNAESASRTL